VTSSHRIIAVGLLGILLGIASYSWLEARTTSAPAAAEAANDVPSPATPTEAYKPAREPYAGCAWELQTGAGISFFGQRCIDADRTLSLGVSESLPGVFLEEATVDGPVAIDEVIRIFTIPGGDISAVIPVLAQSESWDRSEGCAFIRNEAESTALVTRFDLKPTGDALAKYLAAAAAEPVTSTCDEYGMGNSGIRYFEVHASNPEKAVFLELGQEAPLFDEHSIRVF
jgi:hypothetical protein